MESDIPMVYVLLGWNPTFLWSMFCLAGIRQSYGLCSAWLESDSPMVYVLLGWNPTFLWSMFAIFAVTAGAPAPHPYGMSGLTALLRKSTPVE